MKKAPKHPHFFDLVRHCERILFIRNKKGRALIHARWSKVSHHLRTRKTVMSTKCKINELDFLISYGRKKLATDVDDLALEYVRDCGYLDWANKTTPTGEQLIALMNFTTHQK